MPVPDIGQLVSICKRPFVVSDVVPSAVGLEVSLLTPPMLKEGCWQDRSRWLVLLAVLPLIIGAVSGCDDRDKKSNAERAAERQAELAKFAIPDLARAEIERRLALRLVRHGLTLMAKDVAPLSTIYILPIGIPWVVSCDILGLSVKLGSNFSEADSVSIDIISLESVGDLSVDKCQEIAPILGSLMTAMTYTPARFR
jgi:hypothetical protein